MSSLSYLVSGFVEDATKEIDGKTLTVPTLLVSDSNGVMTYGVDVDIGQKRIDPNTGDEEITPLRNVPIAAGNGELVYAEVGAAVRLRRSDSGRLEVIGYSKRLPGTYTRIAVTIGPPGLGPVSYDLGTPTSVGLHSRRLTLGELADYGGGFGSIPLGTIALFRGDTLIELRT